MLRRVHIPKLSPGSIALPAAEAHHIRDVLRLEVGSAVQLFDALGNVASGVIRHVNSANVVIDVETVQQSTDAALAVTVAAAVPKGDRADWMVEKLTELGVARFIPLVTERSVVLPAGRNKIERWERIAIESAKQSRRRGVMAIAPLTPLEEVLSSTKAGIYLSTATDAVPIRRAIEQLQRDELMLLIGAEGGWADGEMDRMKAGGFVGAGLTSTILRVETAAVTAAGVVLCQRHSE